MPNIVVNDIPPRIQYVAHAGDTVFSFPFLMFNESDISVFVRGANDLPRDLINKLTLNHDYTVTINPPPAVGGQITLLNPTNLNDVVTLVRSQPDQRLNYYIQGGPFTSDMVNFDFDQIVLMDQQSQMYDKNVGIHYDLNAVITPNVDNYLDVLPPNCTWMKNDDNSRIIAVPFTGGGGGGGGNTVIITVTQPAHGFTVDQVVYHDGVDYQLARADTSATAEVIGMVASVTDVNTFDMLVCGQATTITAFAPGVYFLSPTVAGTLVNVEPTTPGQISKPLFIAVSNHTGFFFNFRGKVIEAPPTPPVAPDQSKLKNNITQAAHGFNIGNVLYLNAGVYTKAKADNPLTAEVVGIVSGIIDANNFTLTNCGYISGLASLVAGSVYYLSDTVAGQLTATEPTTLGFISKPLLIADTPTSGYFFNMRGKVVASPFMLPTIIDQSTTPTTVIDNGVYIIDAGASVATLIIPAVTNLGFRFTVLGNSVGGWKIQANAGQVINIGSTPSSPGGSVASSNQFNSVVLMCTIANTKFGNIGAPQGTLTVL